MHKSAITPSVIERVTQRRGGLLVFDRLAAHRTAHVVVDLQNGSMAAGAVAEIPEARAIVPAVNRISEAVRDAGGLVVYIQNTFDEVAIRTWSTDFDHFCSPARRERMIEAFTPGADGHALWAGLDVRAEDLRVRKRRFGAFVPGSSDLHAILQEHGVDTLIITGTASQVCCESTARDAWQHNYTVISVADMCSSVSSAMHGFSIAQILPRVSRVRNTTDILAALGD